MAEIATVELPAELVAETAAALLAAAEFSRLGAGNETPVSVAADYAAYELLGAAADAGGDAFWIDPLVVEARIRMSAHLSKLLTGDDVSRQARKVKRRQGSIWNQAQDLGSSDDA